MDEVWPEAKPMIERALAETGDEYNVDDIKHDIITGSMQLWGVYNSKALVAVWVTSIIDNGKNLAVLFAGGGDMHDWLHLSEMLFDWGRANGCTCCEVHGRVGWEKVLRPFGFERRKIVLNKTL